MQGQALLQKIPRHEITGSPSFGCELFSTLCMPLVLFGRVSNFSRQYILSKCMGIWDSSWEFTEKKKIHHLPPSMCVKSVIDAPVAF